MKRVGIVLLVICVIISLPFLSAGIFDFFKKDPQLSPSDTQDLSVTVGNNAPTVSILAVENNETVSMDDTIDLIPAGVAGVNVSFSVTDVNGAVDIDDSTLVVSLGLAGDATRTINGASSCASSDSGNTRYYNCTVDMQFYDGASASWNANVTIDDFASDTGQDLTHTFTVSQSKHISLILSTVSFGTIFIGSTNTSSTVNTTVTNEGNFEVPIDGELTVTASPLVGETNALQNIPATSFRTAINSTTEFANFCGLGTGASGVSHTGGAVNIPNDNLPKGSDSSPISKESYIHCLVQHSVTQAQVYSTSAGGTPWTFVI